LPHLRAGGGPQDVPAGYLEVNRIENGRPASHPQLPQAGSPLEAAVGSLNPGAKPIEILKHGRRLRATTDGKTTLLGGVLKTIALAVSGHRTLFNKCAPAARRVRHNRFCFSRSAVMNGRQRLMTGRAADDLFRRFINVKIGYIQLVGIAGFR
jgi:hypothetical protein